MTMQLATRARLALGALACATLLAAPLAATAQPFPDEHVQGVVQNFDGQERLSLRDDRGFVDDVALGDQTRITPEGTRLTVGMRVAITGYNGGKWFDATKIEVLASGPAAPPSDTPSYGHDEGAPSYPYPYPQAYAYPYPVYAYPYPYPVYGYPYPYYGPYYGGARVNIGLRFNFGGWGGGRGWHR
jgi:hypothetical protein